MTIAAQAIRHRVPVNGITLAVVEYPSTGPSGPIGDLVLLHGIGSTSASWLPVVERLSAHFRLIVPDLRGHGSSDKPEHGYLVPDYADDLHELLAAFRIEAPLLLGHSLGGLVSLRWAVEHPRRAAAIVIEDSPLRGGPHVIPRFDEWIAMAQMTPDQLRARYASEYPDWSIDDCRRRADAMTSVALPVFQEMREKSLDPDELDRIEPLVGIQSPILMVHGDLETGGMVRPEDIARFTASLTNARATRVPGAGHSVHRDHPETFVDAVLPFLTDAAS